MLLGYGTSSVITAIDGREVDSLDELEDCLFEETRPGETVALTVLRNGQLREVRAELGQKSLPR